jgi:hypothetical protein
VVIDQSLLEVEPDESELVLQHIGMAIPLHVNFAISGVERVARELRMALHRRKREVLVARQGAEQALRNELKGTVTALLLSCDMALQAPNMPGAAEAKLRTVYDLAKELRTKLGVPPSEQEAEEDRVEPKRNKCLSHARGDSHSRSCSGGT